MNILIDTNIILNLEDNKVLQEEYTKFIQLAMNNGCKIYYHKDCEKDIGKDKEEERRKITLSKLKKYLPFPNPGIPTSEFDQLVGMKNPNDSIDNKQLYQAYLKYVDFFVTEDKGIHKKASKLNLKNVVFIKKALELLIDRFKLKIPQHPILEHVSLRALMEDLSSNFFDTLREDYNEFNEWFANGARIDRKCYVFKSKNIVNALLIYKEETASDHHIPNIHEDALKMCTFKVAETAFGSKIGELFLSKMFALCIEKNIPYLYLTVYDKHEHLIRLLLGFGFEGIPFVNKKGKNELIYVKALNKSKINMSTIENPKIIHPFYRDETTIDKYVIPIQDKFYGTLFKDGALRQSQLFDKDEISLNEIQGNTITKAYVSASPRKSLKEGSILFFYSSKNKQVIEPVGILESLTSVSDFIELKSLVSKRTVFADDELMKMLQQKKKLTVLLFRLVYYIERPINFRTIKTLISFSNKFTTITTLKEEDYLNLKNKNYFDERYIIN